MTLPQPRNTCCFGIAGTDTFRRNSSGYLRKRFGRNMQNPSKDLCALYGPDPGKDLCQVDQSGAEALVVAYLTKAGKFRDLFIYGIKPHVYIGLAFPEHWQEKYPQVHKFRDMPISEIKTHPEWKELENAIKDSDNNPTSSRYYYFYKQTCHSSNYGIEASTFQTNLLDKSQGKVVLSKMEAEKFLNGYHNLFPEIRAWHGQVKSQLIATRTLYNLFGYPRYFGGEMNEKFFKEAYSFIPQSTVGCITAIAICDLQDYIVEKKLDWDILNDKHDSYLVQCPSGESQECCRVMRQFMEQELTSPDGTKFRMRSEAQIGTENWKPFHPKYNPGGMKTL